MNHGEAFCLMTYEDENTGKREILWNARDGVTPFAIFLNATIERVRLEAEKYVHRWSPDIIESSRHTSDEASDA